jgi:hypothetical protein
MWNSCVLTIAFAAPVSSSDSAFNRAEDVFDTGILGGAHRSGCLLANLVGTFFPKISDSLRYLLMPSLLI